MKRFAVFALAVSAALSGCTTAARIFPASRERTPLERALDENKRLKEQIATENQVNHDLAYQLEIARIDLQKAQAALAAKEIAPAETVPAFQDFEVARIQLGMLTGPAHWSGGQVSDGIAAYLLPKDSNDDTIKRKGNCLFELIDVSNRSEKVIMSWPMPADALGSHWESIPPGYRVRLPWQGEVPWGDDCVFRATFTDAYGRAFTATRLFRLPKPPAPAPPKESGSPAGGAE